MHKSPDFNSRITSVSAQSSNQRRDICVGFSLSFESGTTRGHHGSPTKERSRVESSGSSSLIGSRSKRLFRWAIKNRMASVMLLSADVETNSTLSSEERRAGQ